MENKIYKLTDLEFSNLVKSSLNISEVLFKLGYTTVGNSWGYSQVKQRMRDLNLSGKDFRGKSSIVSCSEKKEVDASKLLCENSKHARNILRSHILRFFIDTASTEICSLYLPAALPISFYHTAWNPLHSVMLH